MPHPLQSEAWGEFRSTMGIDVAHLGDWILTFHKIPHTPWTIGYFPKGPMPTKAMLETLKTLGKQKNAIFIQLEPNVIRNTSNEQRETKEKHRNSILETQNLRASHHPLFTKYTFILDLTKSEEELMAAMHPKTRYNIRVAQKHGVTVSEDDSQKAFQAYLDLSQETTIRQGFYAHNQTYHRTMWNTLHKSGMAHLFTATYEDKILAAWIIFVFGDTVYYPYGASSRENRDVMAPNLMLWEIVRWAKDKKIKYFDLWGAMGPDPDPKDPWYGFHRFKEGFRPNLVEYVGSYDLVIHPWLYRLYTVIDTIRWALLKLKRT